MVLVYNRVNICFEIQYFYVSCKNVDVKINLFVVVKEIYWLYEGRSERFFFNLMVYFLKILMGFRFLS